MIVRNCAGGVVFWGDQVFLLKNDKGEWVLPKGVIRDKRMPAEVALERVKTEAGVCAQIVSTAVQSHPLVCHARGQRKIPHRL